MAVSTSISEAFEKAFMADEKSAFGGVIALNQPCDLQTAQALTNRFIEIVIAPSFAEDALTLLSYKKALRLLTVNFENKKSSVIQKFLPGGMLMQARDDAMPSKSSMNVVTGEVLTDTDFQELLFAWQVVKQVKSNAIVISKDRTSIGIGAGQVSRVDAVEIAIHKSGDHSHGAVLASDAFFPFRDSIYLIAKSGIKMIIQPGGSKRDSEVIQAAKDHGITMVFTGLRAFNH